MVGSDELFMEQRETEQGLSVTEKLGLFQTNKSDRSIMVGQIMDAIEGGGIDPLLVHVQIKCMEEMIFQLTSTDEKKNKDGYHVAVKYKKAILEAAQKYAEKSFSFMNAKIEQKEVGTKYDWSKCEDPVLTGLLDKQVVIDAEVKKRQEFLKTVSPKGMVVTDEDTGETFKVYPPSKSSTTSIAVSLR